MFVAIILLTFYLEYKLIALNHLIRNNFIEWRVRTEINCKAILDNMQAKSESEGGEKLGANEQNLLNFYSTYMKMKPGHEVKEMDNIRPIL